MSPRKSSETFCYFVATFFIHTVYKKREMKEKRARCIYFNAYKHMNLYNVVCIVYRMCGVERTKQNFWLYLSGADSEFGVKSGQSCDIKSLNDVLEYLLIASLPSLF